ncbi:MAG: hypothetical protein D6816_13075 [Bacteroidetes bacterium]|nr:MAG: hypothetical protein D6816_13075 [Bacteroidota bacterium]
MAPFRKTYHSKVYRDFRAIDPRQWHNIVRFFEQHEEDIKLLEFDEYFELLVAYTNALFEIGAYEKHILMVDAVIETAVGNNITFFQGEELFNASLFRKAASCFHTFRLKNAEYILKELLKIDPHHKDAKRFLKKCLRSQHPPFIRNARAISVLLFFIAAVIICAELIWTRNFHPEWLNFFHSLRNVVFGSGILLLVGSTLWHYRNVSRKVENMVKELKARKQKIQGHRQA